MAKDPKGSFGLKVPHHVSDPIEMLLGASLVPSHGVSKVFWGIDQHGLDPMRFPHPE
jgi:hypothetical protein